MILSFKNRDSTGELIAFVSFKGVSFYCLAPVDVWIGSSWRFYLDWEKNETEDKHLGPLLCEFLYDYRVGFCDLQKAYSEIEREDLFNLEANKPKVYVDLVNNYFASYFQEQDLEDRVPGNWTGEYRQIEDLIPKEFRYWE